MSRSTTMQALLWAVATLPISASAQGAAPNGAPTGAAEPRATGRITGTVIRTVSAAAIPGAAVGVRTAADSALVGGAFADENGVFRIDGLPAGRYIVRVRVMGFAPVQRNDVVVSAAAPVELGRIELTPIATVLSDVTVTAERTDVAVAPDRTSYTVKDMPAASGGSAVDVLRNVPSVEVDGDNKVSLRGNENVVVQINGWLSPMRGEALGNFLAQLPSNLVARIEVVPNPSAKNDPAPMLLRAGVAKLSMQGRSPWLCDSCSTAVAVAVATAEIFTGVTESTERFDNCKRLLSIEGPMPRSNPRNRSSTLELLGEGSNAQCPSPARRR